MNSLWFFENYLSLMYFFRVGPEGTDSSLGWFTSLTVEMLVASFSSYNDLAQVTLDGSTCLTNHLVAPLSLKIKK